MMQLDFCHLCGQNKQLRKSHVLPRFAYKRYVADQSRGGSFADIQSLNFHNRQTTRSWFCDDCEQKLGNSESYVAELLKGLEDNRRSAVDYDRRMLSFATSISWRMTKIEIEGRPKMPKLLRLACRRWKDFLRGKAKDLGPYTQHAFISFGESIEGKDAEWHKSIGSEFFEEERLVLSRIGPLLIVGLIDQTNLSLSEINTWCKSEISLDSGTVYLIHKNQREVMLTGPFARLPNKHETNCVERSVHIKGRE